MQQMWLNWTKIAPSNQPEAVIQSFQSKCEESPPNEFEEMEELLVGLFPTIFFFGRACENNSVLNPRQIQGFPFARMWCHSGTFPVVR